MLIAIHSGASRTGSLKCKLLEAIKQTSTQASSSYLKLVLKPENGLSPGSMLGGVLSGIGEDL